MNVISGIDAGLRITECMLCKFLKCLFRAEDEAPPPAKPVESPDGSTAPIEDAKGNLWNLAPASDPTLGNQVTMNGKLAGYSANVTLLLYFNHTVYQQNNAGGWWSWDGTTWVDATDPRPVVQPLATFLT